MRTVLAMTVAVSLVAGAFGLATAADEKKANPQQERMKACNTQAGDKKGDERKAFMKTCLSAKPAPPPKAESKMAMCNKQTAGMKADERAKAQSECMKGS